jgi:hypothetical protein
MEDLMTDNFKEFETDPDFEYTVNVAAGPTYSMRGMLHSAEDARTYVLAGKATITLVSRKTGTRFTYRITKTKQEGRGPVSHFVAVLTGANNEGDYQYLGNMRSSVAGVRFEHGRKSRISLQAPSFRAFEWFWAQINRGKLPDALEVWHEGSCCRCGRKLTVPESVERGIGPECATKMHLH